MSKSNGNNGVEKQVEKRDPDTGKFLPGHQPKPGPGRPKGSVSFVTALEMAALEDGMTLTEHKVAVARKLCELIDAGDIRAIQVWLDRMEGPLDRTAVAVQVNNTTAGPRPPEPGTMHKWLEKLGDVASRQGLVAQVESEDDD